jgi:hypothetical protein
VDLLLTLDSNQSNPADMKTICSKQASTVQKDIQSACSGSDTSTALSSFADTCKQAAGVTVCAKTLNLSSSEPIADMYYQQHLLLPRPPPQPGPPQPLALLPLPVII